MLEIREDYSTGAGPAGSRRRPAPGPAGAGAAWLTGGGPIFTKIVMGAQPLYVIIADPPYQHPGARGFASSAGV